MKKRNVLKSQNISIKDSFIPQKVLSNGKSSKLEQSEDIINNFVLDEEENNIIYNSYSNIDSYLEEDVKPKKIKVKYKVSSFISSTRRPDLYCPLGYISGNKYELINNEIAKEEDIKEIKKEDEEDIISISSFDSFEEEKNKQKIERYFNIENDISSKCSICGTIGHKRQKCPLFQIKFCYRCCQRGHEDNDEKHCYKKHKCFRCNKYGHITSNCTIDENNLIICEECGCIGHKTDECLKNPREISLLYLKYNKFSCSKCGSYEHVLCTIVDRELPFIKNEEEKEFSTDREYLLSLMKLEEDEGQIYHESVIKKNTDINNEDFKEVIFCGFCGGMHRNDECKYKDHFNYKFDEKRKNEANEIIKKREIKRKNLEFVMQISEDSLLSYNTENNINDIISLNEEDEKKDEEYHCIDLNKKKKKKRKKRKRAHKHRKRNIISGQYGEEHKTMNNNQNNEVKYNRFHNLKYSC